MVSSISPRLDFFILGRTLCLVCVITEFFSFLSETLKNGCMVLEFMDKKSAQNRKKPAVFLDRDGVINKATDHIKHISEFEIYPEAFKALKLLKDDFHLIVVTNQSGLSTGLIKQEHYDEIKKFLIESMDAEGITLKAIYECPHHDDNHFCRKPNTGMIEQAVEEHDIDLSRSFMIGDSTRDINMANRLGIPAILVKTGLAGNDKEFPMQPDYVAENILHAAEIVNRLKNKDRT